MTSKIRGGFVSKVEIKSDERGCVKKIMHQAVSTIEDVYVTTVHRGAIKGWHGYKTKEIGFTCVKGKIKLVLWNKEDGDFEEHFIGDENPVTIWASPGVFTAFKGIAEENIIVVIANEEYDDRTVIRISPDNYDWDIKNG